MNKAVPWSIKGVDFDARTAAKEAARRAGMTLGEWLNSVIAEQAAEQGLDPEDIGEEERVNAVRSRLERMSPAAPANGLRRRSDRPAVPRGRFRDEPEPDYADDFDREIRAPRRQSPPLRQRQPRAGYHDEHPEQGFAADALLDDAVRSFEREARRSNAQTSAALDSVARRLENIEGRLETRRAEPEQDRTLKRVISRLESRIEALASRDDPEPAPRPASRAYPETSYQQQAPAERPHVEPSPIRRDVAPEVHAQVQPPSAPPTIAAPAEAARSPAGGMRSSDLARIEAKLNKLLEREAQPIPADPAVFASERFVPERAQTPAGFYRNEPGVPPSRRPLADSIAEINRRQADLDRGFARAGSNFGPSRMAPRAAQHALAYAAAMPQHVAPQQAVLAEPNPELRATVATLKGEIADLSRHIENLRREAAKPQPAPAETVTPRDSHESTAAQQAIDSLRREIADVSAAIGKLAPRESFTILEMAIRDLGSQVRVSRNSGGGENILAPVEKLIGDLKRQMADFAPRSAIETIERDIQAINVNIESMSRSGFDSEAFQRACTQTAEIRNLLTAAAARSTPLESVEKQISSLARRVDIIAARGLTPVGVNAVNESVGEIRAAMELATPAPILIAIEERMEELARKIDEAAARPAPANAQLDDISSRLDSLHKSMASQAADRSAAQANPAAAQFDAIAQRLDAVQKAIAEQSKRSEGGLSIVAPPVEQLDDITKRLADLQKAVMAQAGLAPLASGEVAPLQVAQLETIAKRLDAMQQTINWQAERQPLAKVDTSLLEGMLQQIMDRVNKPAGANLDGFERSLRDLAERVDRISTQPELEGLGDLEARINSIASKLDRPDFSGQPLGDIEGMLSQLSSKLEENRLSAIDAASNAARSAARDVLGEILHGREGGSGEAPAIDGARELIAKEIAGLRSLQDASDRRTHATLGAVHETLEKVVDRLAMLEDEIGDSPAVAHTPAARDREEMLASGPAPVFSPAGAPPAGTLREEAADSQNEAVQNASELAVDSAPWDQRRDRHHSAPPVDTPVHPAVAAAVAPRVLPPAASLDSDFLIEPGSGKRPSRNAAHDPMSLPQAPAHQPGAPEAAAPEPESNPPGRAAASNFIAAARRAQQAAQARADQEAALAPPPKRGIKALAPENALADARSRAKAAASMLSGSLKRARKDPAEVETPSRVPGAPPAQKQSLFKNRKILFSLAGLVLVLGALTIIRQNMMRAPPRAVADTPVSAPAVSGAASPAPQAALPANEAAPSSPLSSAPSNVGAAPASPFTLGSKPPGAEPPASAQGQPAQQRTDRSPVSSIPTFAGGGKPAAGNLRVAATGGDPAAQYELAVRFAEGRDGARDSAGAAQLLEKAAQKGLAPAQYRLGSLYEKGIGVEKNSGLARHWYEQAASAGNVKAMHNFAVLLAEGGDGKPDYATASSWFKRAAEHGVRDSQYNLAILYARGLGIEQSLVESYVWLALAEGQGDTDAGAKRTDVAKRLTPGQLAEAQARVKSFRPQKANVVANEVPAPPGGWSSEPAAASAPVIPAPALGAPSAPVRTPGARRPKVSSL